MTKAEFLTVSCKEASDRKLSQAEITEIMKEFTEWEIDEDGMLLTSIELDTFLNAIGLVYEIAALAESEGHHPNILIHDYNYVSLMINTHSVDALTAKDFALASKIDSLFVEEQE